MAQTPSTQSHRSLQAYPDAVLSAKDPASGTTFAVEADGVTVVAKNAAGKRLWHVDVIAQCGPPGVGAPVVRGVRVAPEGALVLVVGKHRTIELDLLTGKTVSVMEN